MAHGTSLLYNVTSKLSRHMSSADFNSTSRYRLPLAIIESPCHGPIAHMNVVLVYGVHIKQASDEVIQP
jgi:hypothetical protein